MSNPLEFAQQYPHLFNPHVDETSVTYAVNNPVDVAIDINIYCCLKGIKAHAYPNTTFKTVTVK